MLLSLPHREPEALSSYAKRVKEAHGTDDSNLPLSGCRVRHRSTRSCRLGKRLFMGATIKARDQKSASSRTAEKMRGCIERALNWICRRRRVFGKPNLCIIRHSTPRVSAGIRSGLRKWFSAAQGCHRRDRDRHASTARLYDRRHAPSTPLRSSVTSQHCFRNC